MIDIGDGRKVTSEKFYLTSLDGEREKAVPLNDVDAALYIEKYDVLVTGVTRGEYFPVPHEVHDMWIYSFTEDKGRRLFKDTWVNIGGLIWNEKNQ